MSGGRTQRTLSFSNEDFPALPGATSSRGPQVISRQTSVVTSAAPLEKTYATKASLNKGPPFVPGAPARNLNPVLDTNSKNWPPISPSGKPGATPASAKSNTKAGVASPNVSVDSSSCLPSSDRWGLLGLLSVIKTTNPDMQALALGSDLTTLGLNLNSSDALYSSFTSPFMDVGMLPGGAQDKTGLQSEYFVPPCYSISVSPSSVHQKVLNFSDETLFYMFYAMPRDQMQQLAARELANRNWRYHKEIKLWLTKDPSAPEPSVQNTNSERGTYIFFDYTSWEKVSREYTLYYKYLENPGNGATKPFATVESTSTAAGSGGDSKPRVTDSPNATGFEFGSGQGPGDLFDPKGSRGLAPSVQIPPISTLAPLSSLPSDGAPPSSSSVHQSTNAESNQLGLLRDALSPVSLQAHQHQQQPQTQPQLQTHLNRGQVPFSLTHSPSGGPSSSASYQQRFFPHHHHLPQQQQQHQAQHQQMQHTPPGPLPINHAILAAMNLRGGASAVTQPHKLPPHLSPHPSQLHHMHQGSLER